MNIEKRKMTSVRHAMEALNFIESAMKKISDEKKKILTEILEKLYMDGFKNGLFKSREEKKQ